MPRFLNLKNVTSATKISPRTSRIGPYGDDDELVTTAFEVHGLIRFDSSRTVHFFVTILERPLRIGKRIENDYCESHGYVVLDANEFTNSRFILLRLDGFVFGMSWENRFNSLQSKPNRWVRM